jgi:hypothetical protein
VSYLLCPRAYNRHQLLIAPATGKVHGEDRLEFLRQLVPHATRIAVLVNPSDAARAEVTLRDAEAVARTMGLEIQLLNADTADEIDSAFVAATPFLSIHLVQIAQLAPSYRLPAAH